MTQADAVARATAVGLGAGLVAFQVALAAGVPWGELAWGGQHPGTLPPGYRVASSVSAVVWSGAVVAAARHGRARWSGTACTAYTIVTAIGTAMNAASPSPPERYLWTPVAAALSLSLGRLAWSSREGAHVGQ